MEEARNSNRLIPWSDVTEARLNSRYLQFKAQGRKYRGTVKSAQQQTLLELMSSKLGQRLTPQATIVRQMLTRSRAVGIGIFALLVIYEITTVLDLITPIPYHTDIEGLADVAYIFGLPYVLQLLSTVIGERRISIDGLVWFFLIGGSNYISNTTQAYSTFSLLATVSPFFGSTTAPGNSTAFALFAVVLGLRIVGAFFLLHAFNRVALSLNSRAFKAAGFVYPIAFATSPISGSLVFFLFSILTLWAFISIRKQVKSPEDAQSSFPAQ
jgi:hypothetical protein